MIKINNITKRYENGYTALRDVDLTMPSRGLVAIVGESGAGKSTLLNILSGNDIVTSGNISIDEVDYKDLSKDMNRAFAYIYQDYKLIEGISVYDNIKVSAELAKGSVTESELADIIAKVGMTVFKDELVNNLSGGQKQRVAIARSLIRSPKVILADEPTGNLDSENKRLIFELLQSVASELLVVIVTHDEDKALKYADRVIKLSDGKVVEDNIKNNLPTCNGKVQSTNKGGKVGYKSVLKLAKAFNHGQKAKRIVYAVASIILICLLMTSLTWSLVTYEKSIYDTIISSNSNALGIEHRAKRYAEERSPKYNKDLSELKEYLLNDLGIESVPAYSKYMLSTREASGQNISVIDKNLKLDNVYDRMILNNSFDFVVVADDLAKINLELTHGRTPKTHNEILIPKSKIDAMLNGKCFYLGQDIKQDINSVEDIYNKELGEIRIVGAFNDYLDFDKEYKKYAYNNNSNNATTDLIQLGKQEYDEMSNKALQQLDNNYLTNCVIVSSDALNYYNSMMHIASRDYREVNIKTKIGNARDPYRGAANDINLLPQNSYTVNVLKDTVTLQGNEILVSKALINNLVNTETNEMFKVGDKIKLSSFMAQYESDEFVDTEGFYKYRTTKDIIKNKEFIIAGTYNDLTNSLVVMSQDNFHIITGGIKLQINGLFINHNNLKLSDVKNITNFIDKNISKVDIGNYLTVFNHNNADGITDNVGTAIILKYLVAIALSLVLFALIALFTYSAYSNSLKSKASEVLVLRSLGASKGDICKIFFVHSMVLCAIQLMLGIALGALTVYLLNYMAISVVLKSAFIMFSVDAIAMIIVLVGVIIINIVTLVGGILCMSDKNLRRAFQRAKL